MWNELQLRNVGYTGDLDLETRRKHTFDLDLEAGRQHIFDLNFEMQWHFSSGSWGTPLIWAILSAGGLHKDNGRRMGLFVCYLLALTLPAHPFLCWHWNACLWDSMASVPASRILSCFSSCPDFLQWRTAMQSVKPKSPVLHNLLFGHGVSSEQ